MNALFHESPLKAYQSADLSSDSMKLWGQYPDLAVFPGTVLLNDDRPGNPDYPSSSLTQAQLSAEEPALSSDACQAGARLYLQEGTSLLCICRQADIGINQAAVPKALSGCNLLQHARIAIKSCLRARNLYRCALLQGSSLKHQILMGSKHIFTCFEKLSLLHQLQPPVCFWELSATLGASTI